MARNTVLIAAPPEAVFDVLLDAHAYPRWVPGSRRTEAVDHAWPKPGSGFRVRFAGGVKSDRTEMVEAHPPDRVVLQPHVWPLGATRVVIDLERRGDRTFLSLVETPHPTPRAQVVRWGTDLMLFVRNLEGLRRLRRLVEERRGRSRDDRNGAGWGP